MRLDLPDLSDLFDDDDDDELAGLELLTQMRPRLEELAFSEVAARDPKTMAAVRRVLEQERTGDVDLDSDEHDADMRLVLLGLLRIDYEEQKRLGLWPPPA